MQLRHIFITSFSCVLMLAPMTAQSDSDASKSWRLDCRVGYNGPSAPQSIFVVNAGTRAVPGGTKVRWEAGRARGEYKFNWPLAARDGKIIATLPPGDRELSCSAG